MINHFGFKSINNAYLKVKPNRSEKFKIHLKQLIDQINEHETGEFHKNLVIDFLKKTYYHPDISTGCSLKTKISCINSMNLKAALYRDLI